MAVCSRPGLQPADAVICVPFKYKQFAVIFHSGFFWNGLTFFMIWEMNGGAELESMVL